MGFALKLVIGLKVLHIFVVYEIEKLFERDSTQNLPEGESSWREGRNGAVELSQLFNPFCLPLKLMIFHLTETVLYGCNARTRLDFKREVKNVLLLLYFF